MDSRYRLSGGSNEDTTEGGLVKNRFVPFASGTRVSLYCFDRTTYHETFTVRPITVM